MTLLRNIAYIMRLYKCKINIIEYNLKMENVIKVYLESLLTLVFDTRLYERDETRWLGKNCNTSYIDQQPTQREWTNYRGNEAEQLVQVSPPGHWEKGNIVS